MVLRLYIFGKEAVFRNRTLEVKVVKQPLGKSTETQRIKEPVTTDYTEVLVTLGLVVGGVIVVNAGADTIRQIAVHAAKTWIR